MFKNRSGSANSNYRHGACGTRIYNIYAGMHERCCNKNSSNYSYYGGRGIRICDEWMNQKDGRLNFLKWAESSGYKDGLTLDRIDVDGEYSPENCRWVTKGYQSFNQRPRKSKSGVRGVYFRERTGKYLVNIGENGKQHHVGCFSTLEEAIAARKAAEVKYYGKSLDN